MKPQISEFSYGFALTNELVGWEAISAAPVFPSLLEEGRMGGGYDVKLERPGVPLYLQFKRSEFLTTRNGREVRILASRGQHIRVPYYRFPVTDTDLSDQHNMLLGLDVLPNFVFYAAPRFHRLDEINAAWHDNAVASRSQFVAPQSIGALTAGRHTVAFDAHRYWVCSEPRQIEGLSSRQLIEKLRTAVSQDTRPLREKLPEINKELAAAEERGKARIAEQRRKEEEDREEARWRQLKYLHDDLRYDAPRHAFVPSSDRQLLEQEFEPSEEPPIAIRPAKPLPPEMRELREAADKAAHTFGGQLVIVQPPG